MSIKIKFKKGDLSLLLSHNKKILFAFHILEIVSIISLILGVIFIVIFALNVNLSYLKYVSLILLGLGFIGVIPNTSLKNKISGYKLVYYYFISAALIIAFARGENFPFIINSYNYLNSGIGSILFKGILLSYIPIFLLLGALVALVLTALIWGISYVYPLRDTLITIIFLSSYILSYFYFKVKPFSIDGFFAFIVSTALSALLLGIFEKDDVEYFTFADLTVIFAIILVNYGIPFSTLYYAVDFGSAVSALTIIEDMAVLFSFFIASWIGLIAINLLVKEIMKKRVITVGINTATGIAMASLMIFMAGIYLRNVTGFVALLSNVNLMIYSILALFILAFIATLISLLIFGVNKFRYYSTLIGYITFLTLFGYFYIKDLYLPSIIFATSLASATVSVGGGISDFISSKYLNGRSILDKSGTQHVISQNIDQDRPPMCWAKAKSLEGYVVNGVIGVKSGFGYVLDAYDPSSKRRVAIKILKEASDDGTPIAFDANTLNKFNEEHERLKNLKGIKNIVSIFDTHLPEIEKYSGPNRLESYMRSPPYIVMEFLTGGSLSDAYDVFTKKEYIRSFLLIIYGIANGLYEAHSKGILHGDIKPDNIMFASIGRYTFKSEVSDPTRLERALLRGYLIPKLTDFGTAKVMNAGKTTFSTATIHYAPPEILVNQNVIDQRYDIYELGLVMYYELAGVANSPEKAININNRQAELAKLINQGQFFDDLNVLINRLEQIPIDDLRKYNPGVSEKLWFFIRRSIEPNPSKRPKSMKEFANAIKLIAVSDYNLIEINNY